jgi:hypothetical protein
LGDFFFTACISEVNAALLHAVDDRADQVRQAEGLGHVRVHLSRNLPEVIEVLFGEKKGFQLAGRQSFADRWHQVHADSSVLGESAERKSLPLQVKKSFRVGKI